MSNTSPRALAFSAISLVASLITVLVFVTGRNLPDFLYEQRASVAEQAPSLEEEERAVPSTATNRNAPSNRHNSHKEEVERRRAFAKLYASIARATDNIFSASAFSPDGGILALGTWEGPVILWDVKSKSEINQLVRPTSDSVTSFSFIPDTQLLATGYKDNTIKIWNFHEATLVKTLLVGHDIRALSSTTDGSVLAAAADCVPVKLWHTNSWNERARFSTTADYYQSPRYGPTMLGFYDHVNLSSDGGKVTAYAKSGTNDSSIRSWDVRTGRLILDIVRPRGQWVSKLESSSSGQYLIWLEPDPAHRPYAQGTLYTYDIAGRRTQVIPSKAFSFATLPNDRIVVLTEDGRLTLWQLPQLTLISDQESFLSSSWLTLIQDSLASSDGEFLLVRFRYNGAKLWRISTT